MRKGGCGTRLRSTHYSREGGAGREGCPLPFGRGRAAWGRSGRHGDRPLRWAPRPQGEGDDGSGERLSPTVAPPPPLRHGEGERVPRSGASRNNGARPSRAGRRSSYAGRAPALMLPARPEGGRKARAAARSAPAGRVERQEGRWESVKAQAPVPAAATRDAVATAQPDQRAVAPDQAASPSSAAVPSRRSLASAAASTWRARSRETPSARPTSARLRSWPSATP
jgi:hypothetical protein